MIFELTVKNFKRLTAARVTATKAGLVPVTGKNANGKSSFCDAIAAVIGGKKAITGTDTPIHRGSKKAEIILTTDDFTAERVFTASGTELKVTGSDRVPWKRPQDVFDAMVSRFAFDIPAFLRLGGTAQRDAALSAFGLADTLDAITRERDAVYEERTNRNREAKRLAAVLDSTPVPPSSAPDSETSAAEILAELKAANETIEAHKRARSEAWNAQQDADEIAGKVARLTQELADATTAQSAARAAALRLDLESAALVDPDLDAINAKLESVEDLNRAARAKAAYNATGAAYAAAQELADEAQARMDEIEARKAELVKAAKIPVEGLEIREDGLALNGFSLSEASTSEGLRVAAAIAMAPGATLPILRIADGSMFDSASLALLDRMAQERGFLVFVERVSDEPEGLANEVFISDGAAVGGESA